MSCVTGFFSAPSCPEACGVEDMTISNSRHARILVAALFMQLSATGPAFADKVSNSTAASLFTHCFLASDARDIPTIANGCCSFELGYCIECPDSASEKCEKVEIRVAPPRNELEEAAGASEMAPAAAETKKFRGMRLKQGTSVSK